VTRFGNEMRLLISGPGIVFFSPGAMASIASGTDFFASDFSTEEQVQKHVQAGDVVGFGTGSPGDYILRFHAGYPDAAKIEAAEFKLRLGLQCHNSQVHFRDVFDLMDWSPETPEDQMLALENGIYHVTLCSNRPQSRLLGDDQVIDFYLNRLAEFPRLARQGIPSLI
jgi:hypothetical protein